MPSNNRKIVKNTIILYVRMFISMAISLYTSRIIFNTLGIDNFGLYNVVGGIIIFFTFLNSGLTTATRRFITTEIGTNDGGNFQHVFNICVQGHILIAFIVFVFAECIGVFVVNNLLNIPDGRYFAANVVFQVSVFIAIMGIFQSPYSSVIIAHEKMGIYAYFSILDIVNKLVIVYLLDILPGDKLVVFSLLMLACTVINFVINYIYCIRTFIYCKLKKVRDSKLLKDIFKFMSWSLLGQIATVATNQGVSVLVNIYHSVVVNAAMGICSQVTGIVSSFTSNFQTAFNPQIIKLYNNNEQQGLLLLISRAAKISSFLIIFFLVPICFEIDTVLTLWLGKYPEYAPQFVILTLIAIYIESICAPLYMVVYSQTNIRNYQIIISSIYSLNFFIGWFILFIGVIPYWVIAVRIFVFAILMLVRLCYVKKLVGIFNIRQFISDVIIRGLLIFGIVSSVVYMVRINIDNTKTMSLFIVCLVSITTSILTMYFIGLNKQDKIAAKNLINSKLKRKVKIVNI